MKDSIKRKEKVIDNMEKGCAVTAENNGDRVLKPVSRVNTFLKHNEAAAVVSFGESACGFENGFLKKIPYIISRHFGCTKSAKYASVLSYVYINIAPSDVHIDENDNSTKLLKHSQ